MFYIRYRFGHGTVDASPTPTTDVFDAVRGGLVCEFRKADAHGLDGYMTTEDMQRLTAHVMDWSALSEGKAPNGGG